MMTKITLAVSKVYKNAGRFRFHRQRTKKAWKHCFMSDDYTDELAFGTEWEQNSGITLNCVAWVNLRG